MSDRAVQTTPSLAAIRTASPSRGGRNCSSTPLHESLQSQPDTAARESKSPSRGIDDIHDISTEINAQLAALVFASADEAVPQSMSSIAIDTHSPPVADSTIGTQMSSFPPATHTRQLNIVKRGVSSNRLHRQSTKIADPGPISMRMGLNSAAVGDGDRPAGDLAVAQDESVGIARPAPRDTALPPPINHLRPITYSDKRRPGALSGPRLNSRTKDGGQDAGVHTRLDGNDVFGTATHIHKSTARS